MTGAIASGSPSASAVGARLDSLPIGPFHRRLTLAMGCGLLVDGIDTYLTAGVSAALVRAGEATLDDAAHIAVATAIGLALGGFFAGQAADRFGRRRVLMINLVIVIVGGLLAAASQSLTQLLAFRLLTAIGLGGETILAYGLMSEFAPPARRGTWLALLGFVANCGMPLALALGYFILPHPDGWRWLLAVPAVLAFAVIYLRWPLPESPRWLETRGRHDEARAIVDRIAGRPLVYDAHPAPVAGRGAGSAVAMDRARLATAIAINVAVMSGVFGFVSWLPTFFAASGRDIASSALFGGILSLGAPFGTALGLWFTDRIERKWGLVVTALSTVLLGCIYAFMRNDAAILALGLLVVTNLYLFGTFGIVGYVPELFPTAVRMRAMGIAATVGRIFIMMLPFLIVPLFKAGGQAGVLLLVCSILLVTAAIIARFGTTTRGRSLEVV